MDLKTYLFKNNIMQKDFCKLLDRNDHFLCHLISGFSRCSKKIALKIEKLTDGKVKATSLRPDVYQHTPRKKRSKEPKLVQMDAFRQKERQ